MGAHVKMGKNFTYVWKVLEGPSPTDAPCIPYLYFSGTNPTTDTNSGLVGPLLLCKRGALRENGTQVWHTFIVTYHLQIVIQLTLKILSCSASNIETA